MRSPWSFYMLFVPYQRKVCDYFFPQVIKIFWSRLSLHCILLHNNETKSTIEKLQCSWHNDLCGTAVTELRGNVCSWYAPVSTGLNQNIPVNTRACFTSTDFWATLYSFHIVLCCVGSLFVGLKCSRQNEMKMPRKILENKTWLFNDALSVTYVIA
jgi:hypothetical protein